MITIIIKILVLDNKRRHSLMKKVLVHISAIILFISMLVTSIPFTALAVENGDYATTIANGDFSSYYTYLSSQINYQSGIDANITADELQTKLSDSVFAGDLARLELISRCSASVLNSFANTDEHKAFLNWVFGDITVMNKFLQGGIPRDGKILNALTIWEKIWTMDTASRSGIYLTLAMATAFEHANSIDTGWYQVDANNKATIIDPISRYNNYKTAHEAGKLYPVFDTLNVTQMRMVVDAWLTDSDLDWARSTYAGTHSIVSEKGETRAFATTYNRSNIASAGHELQYNSYNAAGVSVQNGALAYYGANATLSKVLSVGSVCGGIAKYGISVAKAYGVPAMPVGQPGHCAAIYNSADGVWSLHNDIDGFGESFTHGGTIIPWNDPGRARYVDGSGNVGTTSFGPAYMLLYEDANHNDAINSTSSIAKSEQLRLLANELKTSAIAQNIRIIAMGICPKNIQIWREYIAALKAANSLTTSDWSALKSNIITTFPNHPRPMTELLTSIQDYVLANATEDLKANYVTSVFNAYEAVVDPQQVSIRNIIEKSMLTWMFEYIPAPAVTFSLSGSNAGRLVGFSEGMSFSIDGGKTFLAPSGTNYKLKANEINALTSENDIWVRNKYIITTDKTKMTVIDIKAGDVGDLTLSVDDSVNTVIGINTTMEFSIDNGTTWKMYTGSNLPNLSGNIAIKIRKVALDTTLGGMAKELIFTDGISTNPMVKKLPNVTYLSDMTWTSSASGWGSVERDTSNGEYGMGDGKNININGGTYTKGLGCHADSTIIYNLDGKYSRFVTDIGADNETSGSVQFEVLADGVSVYKSSILDKSCTAEHVDLNVTNVNTLTLKVTNGGNGYGGDHADWAGAYLVAPVTLNSIDVTTPASKLTYTVGETLDITDMVVTGSYSDNTTKIESITTDNISGFDSSIPVASQMLTVTVNGKSTTYTIVINAVPTYSVTFDTNGGSTVNKQSVTYNRTATVPTPAPTKRGYKFSGWYKEATCINAWNFTTDKVTLNTTLYAKWIKNKYTVTFNSQGGSAVTSKIVYYNSAITAPIAPKKKGYTFGGWYKEATCINVWNFTTNKVTGNTTLYAKWKCSNK
jgi:uncharacterized repeat protein (TIGR02543 family)